MLRTNKGNWSGTIEAAIEAIFQDCQYVQATNQSGTLQLSVQAGRPRFRFIQNDGPILHTSGIKNRRKITAQFADFLKANCGTFPQHFKFEDYGTVVFDFEEELQRQEAERVNQEAERQRQETDRTVQEAKRLASQRKRDRMLTLTRTAVVLTIIILLAAVAFVASFRMVSLQPSDRASAITALSSPTELTASVTSSKFSLEFSNLVASAHDRLKAADLKEVQALAKQNESIRLRDAQRLQPYLYSMQELQSKYPSIGSEKFVELSNTLYMAELCEKDLRYLTPPTRPAEKTPRTSLSAGAIAKLAGISRADALRWKYNLSTHANSENDNPYSAKARELDQLRSQARALESNIHEAAYLILSNTCSRQLKLLEEHEFSAVKKLRTSVQEDICEFEHKFMADFQNRLLVFPSPFSNAIFARSHCRILVLVPPNVHAKSEIIFCDAGSDRESLFDFLKNASVKQR
jgi:hypothetical protein